MTIGARTIRSDRINTADAGVERLFYRVRYDRLRALYYEVRDFFCISRDLCVFFYLLFCWFRSFRFFTRVINRFRGLLSTRLLETLNRGINNMRVLA